MKRGAGRRRCGGSCAKLRESCVDAGATAVTHLFNVMGRLHHRNLSPAALALDDERVACPIIVDGVHVAPAIIRTAYKVLGPDRTILVTDSVGAAGMKDGTYSLAGIEVTAKDGVVRDKNETNVLSVNAFWKSIVYSFLDEKI